MRVLAPLLRATSHTPTVLRVSAAPVAIIPACTASETWAVAAASGITALSLQIILTSFFRRSEDIALAKRPAYMAYQLVAFIYMLFATFVGGAIMLDATCWPINAAAAMLVPRPQIRFLGAVLFGELVLWDVPTCLCVKKLRRADGILHHIGLAFGPALVAMTCNPTFYYSWFIGLSEASSVPLALNEAFGGAHDMVMEAEEGSTRLVTLAFFRDIAQIAAAAAFVIVRVLGWSWMCWLLLRDTLAVLPIAPSAGCGSRIVLKLQLFMASAFYALQLLWFSKLVRFTLDSGLGGSRPDDL
uniref:TLC domain-containing protein n=1 Tax=Coccolithus braarudii TaxID=221442 RepID=A0A7S0L516_9EUKA|mmetsp:Transcript_19441/g.41896  ORF Transcript_19441/g.41896 Transcript_19441/m.41896 type:complete len:300 (+) Transcript_19441:31-930(+)